MSHRGVVGRANAFASIALAGVVLVTQASNAPASPVTTSFTVTGTAGPSTTYTLQDLQALPPVTQTDTFLSGANPVTTTFTGASLWGIVSPNLFADPARKNDVLRNVAVAFE
jgi:hypothetical protein